MVGVGDVHRVELVEVADESLDRLAEHLTRLQNSLDGIRLANPLSAAEWTRLMGEIIASHIRVQKAMEAAGLAFDGLPWLIAAGGTAQVAPASPPPAP